MKPRLLQDRGATFVLDCGHGFGPVAAMEAAALAVERAKQDRHLLRPGARDHPYRRHRPLCAMDRQAGFRRGVDGRRAGADGLSRRAGGQHGDEPDRHRVPSGNGPIVLDMATTTISNGKILQARATGTPLPTDTVLHAAGEPTTDPNQAEIFCRWAARKARVSA